MVAKPVRELPEGYELKGTLDLSRNRVAMIGLNVLGLALLIGFAALFTWAASQLRPGEAVDLAIQVSINSIGDALKLIAGLLGVLVVMVVAHEAAHGVVFWLVTKHRPHFGIGWGYAYAAAPGWFIPRSQYFVTALAPLVLISALGLAVIPFISEALVPYLLLLMVFNGAGAVGDLWVAGWLLLQPRGTLACDTGAAVSLFTPIPGLGAE